MSVDAQVKVNSSSELCLPYGSSCWIGGASDAGGNRLRLHHSGTSGQAYIDFVPSLNFRSGINTVMYLSGDGRLGVGTTSPNQKLEVNGRIRASSLEIFGPGGEFDDVYLDQSNSWGSPALYPRQNCQMEIGKSSNRVNTVNTYQVFYQYGVWQYSDKRLKENIREEDRSMDKISRINSMSYNMRDSVAQTLPEANRKQQRQRNYGFLAQDVQAVYPELVSSDERGYLAVNYVGLIPHLLTAIKELNSRVAGLGDSLAELNTKLADTRAAQEACCQASGSSKLKSGNEEDATSSSTTGTTTTVDGQIAATLGQNAPNPFGSETTIGMYLPSTVQKASLRMYDLTGKQLKAITVNGRGNTSVTINGRELPAGMYHYALVADGQLVGTREMILTE